LHNGTQQRLVALSFELRLARATVPAELPELPELPELQTQICQMAEELIATVEELREIARGIHPSILSEGGLSPALRTLARRAAIPVEVDIRTETRPADRGGRLLRRVRGADQYDQARGCLQRAARGRTARRTAAPVDL
jgi:signal transduction histidine kinase